MTLLAPDPGLLLQVLSVGIVAGLVLITAYLLVALFIENLRR